MERDLDATGPFRHFAAAPRLVYQPTLSTPKLINSATSLFSNFKIYRDHSNPIQNHYDDKDLPSHALPKTMPLPSGKITPKTYELPSRRSSTIPKRRRPHLHRRPNPLNGVHNGARRQHTRRAMLLLKLCCSTQSP